MLPHVSTAQAKVVILPHMASDFLKNISFMSQYACKVHLSPNEDRVEELVTDSWPFPPTFYSFFTVN